MPAKKTPKPVTPAPPPATGPLVSFSGFSKQTIPSPKRSHMMFFREGKFAFSSDAKALWSNPSADRVGWLDLKSGEFAELFACKRADFLTTSGDVAVAAFDGKIVIFDKARSKKPIRIEAQKDKMEISPIAITPDSILTKQSAASGKGSRIQVWDRNTNKAKALPPKDVGFCVVSRAGGAAMHLRDSTKLDLWSPPYAAAQTVELGSDDLSNMAYSSTGRLLAALLKDEVVVVDVDAAKVSHRFKTPPPSGQRHKTPLRDERSSRTWIYPIDNGQVVLVDFVYGLRFHEVTMELWDAKLGKRIALEVATLAEEKDRGVAEEIGISEFGVILNRDLMYRLVP